MTASQLPKHDKMSVKRQCQRVSVIIPTRNEEQYIARCLDSILSQPPVGVAMDLWVVDGESEDATQTIVAEYQRRHDNIHLLVNPQRVVPSALNLAAKHAQGDVLIWLGAHADYRPGYIQKSLDNLLTKPVASVGGRVIAHGHGAVGQAIAAVLASPVGTGNAQYRAGSQAGFVDTVFGGCWWKDDFIAVGGFNENWRVNQDTEFNYRLRKNIGPLYFDPAIVVDHFVRGSLGGLAKQYWRYGFWRCKTVFAHPETFSIRQAIPLIFLSLIILLMIIAPVTTWPLLCFLAMYFCALLVFLLPQVKDKASIGLAIASAVIIHFAWSMGFFWQMISARWRLISNKTA